MKFKTVNCFKYKMEPENPDGNVEYKTKLVEKGEKRITSISSQMRFRCDEGSGEAIYVLGVADNGNLVGLTDDEFVESFNNLSLAARKNNYSITLLSSKPYKDKKVYEILIREKNENKYIDIKVAVAGNVDAGKSSLIGVLISGKLDDGRGRARLSVFNFRHEVDSGRTSSVAQQILGFDEKGEITNYSSDFYKKSWPEIVRNSSKVVSFFDLCGHEKYLKTTILGLSSSYPDICFVVIGGNMGITKMTQEHIFLCITLNIPFVIVVTKIDICKTRQKVLKNTFKQINKLLKMPGLRRIAYRVNSTDDVMMCVKNVHSNSVVPIFPVSSVSGEGIDNIKKFLNLVGRSPTNKKDEEKSGVEYHIETTFSVPGVGTVTGGQLVSGTITVGDKLYLGPNEGKYNLVIVRSIHCKRIPVQTVNSGCYVCLGLKKVDRKSIRRGNVIVSLDNTKLAVKEFDADITVLRSHSTTIKEGYEPVIHSSAVRQAATLIEIRDKVDGRNSSETDSNILRTGDRAVAKFSFKYQPEFMKPGGRILMSEGRVKVIGVIRDTTTE